MEVVRRMTIWNNRARPRRELETRGLALNWSGMFAQAGYMDIGASLLVHERDLHCSFRTYDRDGDAG